LRRANLHRFVSYGIVSRLPWSEPLVPARCVLCTYLMFALSQVEVDLSRNSIPAEIWSDRLSRLAHSCPQLRRLNFSCNRTSATSLRDLCSLLDVGGALSCLTHLDISNGVGALTGTCCFGFPQPYSGLSHTRHRLQGIRLMLWALCCALTRRFKC